MQHEKELYLMAAEKKNKETTEKKYIKQSGRKSLLRIIKEESKGKNKLRINAVRKDVP